MLLRFSGVYQMQMEIISFSSLISSNSSSSTRSLYWSLSNGRQIISEMSIANQKMKFGLINNNDSQIIMVVIINQKTTA